MPLWLNFEFHQCIPTIGIEVNATSSWIMYASTLCSIFMAMIILCKRHSYRRIVKMFRKNLFSIDNNVTSESGKTIGLQKTKKYRGHKNVFGKLRKKLKTDVQNSLINS